MKLTRKHHRDARLLWQAVTVSGVPDANRIREAIRTIQQYEGRGAEAVLRCFSQRLNVYIREHQIGVVSADLLPVRQQEQIAERFRETESVKAGIHFTVDPGVIGGLRIEEGYHVTDLTITRQLEILKAELLKD
jgi:F0F1-type ATP synthase delta subunit